MHLDNLLFLSLLAVAFLFQLLTRAVTRASRDQTKRESTSTREIPPPVLHSPTESDEERIRKFLEALGQPPTSRPPPPVVPRTNIPPRPLAPVQPPRMPTARNILTERRRPVVETTKAPAPLVFGLHEAPPLPKLPASIKPPVETDAIAADSKIKLAHTGIDNIATFLRSPS